MDNTQATTLSDVVETHEFLENPLDVYETYTYNIEWFVVDIDSDRKFQEFGETLSVVEVVNDGWPGIEDTKITIAKTGVTTEFNITDLTVEGSGAGIAETSKIAGTALTLDFTVTEVGTTSLVDNLQNAIALCGWKSIDQTHFYMKINFIGVDANGKKVKIPQTKVLTFTLQRLTNLQSQTDAKGTTTVLRGTILQDSVIGNKLAIGSTEYAFTYEVADSLIDTLGVEEEEKPPKENSFIDELNKSVRVTHPNLLLNLQNTYKITMSDQFKEKFGGASMTGITSSTIKNISNKHADRQVGQVTPLLNIFKIIDDICLNALEIKEELTKDTPKRSKVYKITPWLVPKEGGWNAITGTMAYNVEFFIDFEEKFITQHPLDAANKAANINTTIQQLFKELHINKIYHYLFTGKNDQILDFNITLDSYLAKVYSAPTDWYAYENILKASTIEGNATIDGYRQRYEDTIERGKTLIALEAESATNLKKMTKDFNNFDDSLRNDMLDAYTASLSTGAKNEKGKMLHKNEAAAFFANKSTEDLMDQLSKIEGFKLDIGERRKNRDKWEKLTTDDLSKHNTDYRKMNAWQDSQDTLYGDWIASGASVSGDENWKNGVKQNAQKLLSGVANKNPKNMILLEELDDDIISKMSNEDFESVLRSQANNPVVYKNLITTLSKNHSAVTIKPTDVEKVELARAKYYESKTNDVSMIKANLTIKGDPHWIDGYMPPAVAKREFGDVGAVSNKGYSMQTTLNGYNYLILKSGVAAGTDLHDNILKRNLLTHLYTVNNVVSDFSQGLFTQTLSLTRLTDADDLTSVVPTVGPSLVELGDVNDNKQLLDSKDSEEKAEGDVTSGIITDTTQAHIDANQAHNFDKIVAYAGKSIGEILDDITRTLTKPIKNYFSQTLGERAEKYNTEIEETTENYVAAVAQQTAPNLSFEANAIDRQNHAAKYLNEYRFIDNLCKHQGEGDKTSCEAKDKAQNDILSVFVDANGDPLTIADRGDPAAAALINQQVNDMLTANPNVTVSQYEVAAWQHAIGYELDICRPNTSSCFTSANDKRWIEDHIKYKTGDRTPIKIIDEQQNYEIPSVDVSGQSGAINDNRILNDSLSLNDEVIEGTLINVEEPVIKTMVEIEAELEAVYADPECDDACRNKARILLSKDLNNLAHAEYYKNQEVKKIVDNSCPAGMSNEMNIKKRRLECVPIPKNTLTELEIYDINVLSEEMNGLFQNHELTSEDKNTHQVWTGEAYIALDGAFPTITETERFEVQTNISESVTRSVLLNSLSDNDYREIQGLETGINTVILDAQNGHRGDLTTAVNVGLNEDELAILNEQRAETKTNLSKFNWTTDGRRVFEDELDSIDVDIAKNTLSQFDEHMTAVATICSGLTCEYVPIYNPTKKDDHTTAIIKNADEQFDVVLAGVDNTYAGATTQNNLDQLTQARNIYYELTSTATGMTTFPDDWGVEIEVKDFSNISPIIYTDANGDAEEILDPSTYFGIHTTSYSDIVPGYKQDYKLLREKVADLFPNIEVISDLTLNGIALTLSTLKDGTGMILLNGTAFIINPNP